MQINTYIKVAINHQQPSHFIHSKKGTPITITIKKSHTHPEHPSPFDYQIIETAQKNHPKQIEQEMKQDLQQQTLKIPLTLTESRFFRSTSTDL